MNEAGMDATTWAVIGTGIALMGVMGAMFRSTRTDLRYLSTRIDAQGRELRDRIDAQGKELRDRIDVQGKRSDAQYAELRDRIDAQGKELRERIDVQGGQIGQLGQRMGRIEGLLGWKGEQAPSEAAQVDSEAEAAPGG